MRANRFEQSANAGDIFKPAMSEKSFADLGGINKRIFENKIKKNNSDFSSAYAREVSAIAELESKRPGMVKYLNEFYGLIHFSRYPESSLLKQFDNKANKEKPFGIVLAAEDDYNQGSYSETYLDEDWVKSYQSLDNQLGNDFVTRYVESGGPTDFFSRLNWMAREFGPHSAKFLIMAGHGYSNGFIFSQRKTYSNYISKAHLQDKVVWLDRLDKLLAKDAQIIFDACNVGKRGGFAEFLNTELNREVIAAEGLGSIDGFEVLKNEKGKLRIKPTYSNGAVGQQFLIE